MNIPRGASVQTINTYQEVNRIAYLSPKTIICNFLRKNVIDPRGRISTKSDSFIATASQTVFTLTPTTGKKFSHMESLTVNGSTKKLWRDFYIIQKSGQVVFFTGLTLSDAIIVNYGETSSNWIFTDKPDGKLDSLSFPRINVKIVGNAAYRLGNFDAPVVGVPRFEIPIRCKEKQDNQIFTIDGLKYTGHDLAEYLSYQVTQAFENNESELFPLLWGYNPVGMPTDIPFDDETQCHIKIVECVMQGLDLGRLS